MAKKESAKFFAGFAANQVLVHSAFALDGNLPMEVLGITLTPALNAFAVFFWPIVTLVLVYYAWVKDLPASRRGTRTPAHP